MPSIRSVALAVIALALALAVPRTAAADGDATKGEAKSLACQACHVTGDPASDTPRLVAQRVAYLAAQLTAFRTGDRTSELMTPIASQLSDAEIADLAAYWSGRAADSDATVPDEVAALTRSPMPFPKKFPKGFVVYATKADQGKVSTSYANAIAVKAAKANKPLPDGSVIVVVNASAKLDAKQQPVVDGDGKPVIDKILSYSAMESRKGWGKKLPDLLRNGDWAYNLFAADKTPRATVNHAVCLACHKPTAATSYVFTLEQIRSAKP